MTLCVQYGCGDSAPQGWINFDASPVLWIERLPLLGSGIRIVGKSKFPDNVRYGNIVSGLPLKSGSVECLYASHVLEHIDRSSIIPALENSFRLLAPGGRFRVLVPDLVVLARRYLEDIEAETPFSSDIFLRYCCIGQEEPYVGLRGAARRLFSHSIHRWLYDPAQFKQMLADAGFTDIRTCSFGDSDDLRFGQVEAEDRFVADGMAAVALEARRA